MKRIILPFVIFLGLAAAILSGAYAKRQFERLVVTTSVVVPKVDIPAHTIVSRKLLAEKEVPKTLLREPICRDASEVVGKVSLGVLPAGAVIYRSQLAPLEGFRLTGDPALEIVSFPVDPERAAGGQIRRGMRINIYRIAVEKPHADSANEMLEKHGAAVELLCEAVPVVDVRSTGGSPAGQVRTEGNPIVGGGGEKTVPLKILTVAVPPEVAREIIRLQGEERAGYEFWVTLSPLERVPTPTPTRTPTATPSETGRQGDKETRGPLPVTDTPTSTPTPT